MKKKIFALLALVMTVMTASAIDAPSFELKKAQGAEAHGTITFKVGENTVTSAAEGQTVTVIITPNTGWVVNAPAGEWNAAIAAARSTVPMLNGFELTKSTTAENTWSFVMERADAEISCKYKKLLTHEDIGISGIKDQTYNGQAQTPAVTVTDGEYTLVPGTDYTISYSDNTNAGEATATLKGTGDNYAGEWVMNFTIKKAALTVKAEDKSVTFGDDAPTYTESYDGFVNNETKAVLSGTLSLTCDYVKNTTGAGNYDITPSGLTSSNYDITFTKGTLTVGKKALEDGFIANIASLVYNGVAQEPAPVVTFNGMTLVKGTDYSVSYEKNVNVGTATATVTALANSTKYSGSASKTFSITKKALTVTADNKSVTFGDDAPQYTVSYDGFVNNETKAVLSGTLAFACSYVKNTTAAGNYDITPSGLTSSNYDITFTKGTLTVGKKALEDGFIANIASLVYNGVAQEPAPVVTFNGMTLVKGTDYSVSYENNVNMGTATATVTALANSTKYSGSASKTFTITKKALTVTADNKSVTFGDDAPTYTESYDGFVNNETKAVLGGTLALACSYVKNQTGAGNYDITPSGYTSSNYDITFTKGTLTVGKKALEDGFIANIASLVYNGVAQEPAPVVTFNGMTLVAGTDYTVAYSNNTNVGTATATVTALANSTKYSGSASKTFTITQKEATLQWSNTELVWTGSALKPTCTVTNLCGTDQCDVTVGGEQVEAGTYTATATALANANYKLPQAVTAEYQIIKKLDDNTKDAVEGNVKAEVYDETTKQAVITDMTAKAGETTFTIPANIDGYDVVAVNGTLNNADNITDIYLPGEDGKAITVNDANLFVGTGSKKAIVHAPVRVLQNYAAMLPGHVGEAKLVSEVTQTAQRYWTFSCGVDVQLPEGLEVNIIKARSASEVEKVVVKTNTVKANNGVMFIGQQGVTYTLTALGTTAAGNDYAGNILEPVLNDTHYAYASGYYILKNGQFHAIANDATQIPANKAVLHINGATKSAMSIVDGGETTGIKNLTPALSEGEGVWYDLNGRKLQGMPTTKGIYILNGKKTVIK